jgi:hypothetical protein
MGNRLIKPLAENTEKRKFLHAISIIDVILGIEKQPGSLVKE